MNDIFANKGIEITNFIIKEVIIDPEISDTMEEKTLYASKNTLARKTQCFELRVLNDQREIEIRSQVFRDKLTDEVERGKKMIAEIQRQK
jgi:hypothetical protein